MKLFPKEKFVLITSLPFDVVLQKINNNIKTERDFKGFDFQKNKDGYEGTVFSNNFQINRILKYRNSFTPITLGIVKSTSKGSELNLIIRMEKFKYIFFIIWTVLLGIVSACSLFILIMEFLYSGSFVIWALPGPIMLTLGYWYTISNFKKEMISTKQFLMTLLNADEILPA